MCGNLEDKTDIENRENGEILDNVRTSCEAAVEILNDLLCFDKIESGILDLHKLETPVIPFISDCVKMFSSQAKEAGINISFITSHANAFQLARNVSHGATPSASSTSPPVMSGINVHEQQHVQDQEHPYGSILDSDRVFVDKFKMNQVMRNLISNALKFTPSGGSVVVSAFFLPEERTDVRTVAQRLTSSRTPSNSNCIPSSQGHRKSILSIRSLASQYHRQPRRNRRRKSSVSVHPGDKDDDDDVDVAIVSSSLQEKSTHACSNSNVESNTFYQVATGQRDSTGGNGRGDKTIYSRSLNKVARRSHSKIENPDDNENVILGKLKIVVEDTGCGISDVDRARLFKEIVQFTPEILQAGGGSGLGLYISSHIIQMHSGTIQAISEGVGKGSTFVVELDMRRMTPAHRSI